MDENEVILSTSPSSHFLTEHSLADISNSHYITDEEANDKELDSASIQELLSGVGRIGCSHYGRKCQLVCPDDKCGKIYTCRFCHDEAESGHTFDRYNVKEVVCIICKERQIVSNRCVNCSVTFGQYFCKVCNLFLDGKKDTFHCDGCGLCRVGPKDNFFHCDKCEMCMPIALHGKHKCIEKTSRRDCPVCLEDIHTSRWSSHVPKCGHLLHQHCFNQLINKLMYACPLCNESMVEMSSIWKYLDEKIASSPLPSEYVNEVHILCRDCHKVSCVVFHYLGLKCVNCGGYNTCIERGTPFNPAAFNMNTSNGVGRDFNEDNSDDDYASAEDMPITDDAGDETLTDGQITESEAVSGIGNYLTGGNPLEEDDATTGDMLEMEQ